MAGLPAGRGVRPRSTTLRPPARSRRRAANAEALGLDARRSRHHRRSAPAARRAPAGRDDVIGDRALGGEPMRVAALGRAVLDGLRARGRHRADQAHAGPRPRAGRQPQGTADRRRERGRSSKPTSRRSARSADAPVGMTAHVALHGVGRRDPGTLLAVRDRRDHPPADRLRRAAADRRHRHAGARSAPVPERSRRALAAGVRHGAQLLGQDGRHGRDRRRAARRCRRGRRADSSARSARRAVHQATGRPMLLAKRDELLLARGRGMTDEIVFAEADAAARKRWDGPAPADGAARRSISSSTAGKARSTCCSTLARRQKVDLKRDLDPRAGRSIHRLSSSGPRR